VTKLSDQAFQEKWQYRPVKITGILENLQENLIQRPQNGEKGL
jgi:cytochrome oxidase assembly protein ShyY1